MVNMVNSISKRQPVNIVTVNMSACCYRDRVAVDSFVKVHTVTLTPLTIKYYYQNKLPSDQLPGCKISYFHNDL